MQTEHSQIGWAFWWRWLLSNTVGWITGFLLGFILAGILGPILFGTEENPEGAGMLPDVVSIIWLGASLGVMVGLFQWLVLRTRTSGISRWVMASAAGLAIGAGAAAVMLALSKVEVAGDFGIGTGLAGWVAVLTLGGATAGFLQWRALRRAVSRGGWWVLASTVGWGLSMVMAAAPANIASRVMGGSEADTIMMLSFFGGLVAGGITLGIITGAAIAWLLKQSAELDDRYR